MTQVMRHGGDDGLRDMGPACGICMDVGTTVRAEALERQEALTERAHAVHTNTAVD